MAELLTINRRELQAILDTADGWKRGIPRGLRRGNKILMRGLGADARKRIRKNIVAQRTPDGSGFAPLAKITQFSIPGNTKVRIRGSKHILRDTRQYYKSIKTVDFDGLSVTISPTGTHKNRFGQKADPNAKIGAVHHMGQAQPISVKASKYLARRKKINIKAGTVAQTPSRAHMNLQDDTEFTSHLLMRVSKWLLKISTRRKK